MAETASEERKLRLDAIEETQFRSASGTSLDEDKEWASARKAALERDHNTCYYCGFEYPKYMEVHHKNGTWQNDSIDNLITLCPICHACLHIGHAGLVEQGSLLVLSQSCDQAALNKLVLDSVIKFGPSAVKAVFTIYENLPITKDLMSSGLVILANKIVQEKKQRKKNPRPIADNFIFFPNIMKYNMVRYIIEQAANKG